MPFLGSALGLTAMCSLGWGNLVAFDWNDLPVGREFDCKFLKKVKSSPHALPPHPPALHVHNVVVNDASGKSETVGNFTLCVLVVVARTGTTCNCVN